MSFLPPHHWDSRSQFWGGRWESNQRIEDGVRAIQSIAVISGREAT